MSSDKVAEKRKLTQGPFLRVGPARGRPDHVGCPLILVGCGAGGAISRAILASPSPLPESQLGRLARITALVFVLSARQAAAQVTAAATATAPEQTPEAGAEAA